jgi:hypothetical protein
MALTSPQAAEDAHIVAMMWGGGPDNRVPSWVEKQFATPTNVPVVLQNLAIDIRRNGIISAYENFVPKLAIWRLDQLGTSYSTKDLFFFSNIVGRHRALIFNKKVADWLRLHAGMRLSPGSERSREYGQYLYAVYCWAADLSESPEDIEVVIFGWEPDGKWRC